MCSHPRAARPRQDARARVSLGSCRPAAPRRASEGALAHGAGHRRCLEAMSDWPGRPPADSPILFHRDVSAGDGLPYSRHFISGRTGGLRHAPRNARARRAIIPVKGGSRCQSVRALMRSSSLLAEPRPCRGLLPRLVGNPPVRPCPRPRPCRRWSANAPARPPVSHRGARKYAPRRTLSPTGTFSTASCRAASKITSAPASNLPALGLLDALSERPN